MSLFSMSPIDPIGIHSKHTLTHQPCHTLFHIIIIDPCKTIYLIESKAWIEYVENYGHYVPYNFSCKGVRTYLQIHENIVFTNICKYMSMGYNTILKEFMSHFAGVLAYFIIFHGRLL